MGAGPVGGRGVLVAMCTGTQRDYTPLPLSKEIILARGSDAAVRN